MLEGFDIDVANNGKEADKWPKVKSRLFFVISRLRKYTVSSSTNGGKWIPFSGDEDIVFLAALSPERT